MKQLRISRRASAAGFSPVPAAGVQFPGDAAPLMESFVRNAFRQRPMACFPVDVDAQDEGARKQLDEMYFPYEQEE
ncbi:hypothetical protein [Streptomyces sp. Tue 6075]|uniref:hypothetical protein n=1 Tax=Streptomyces sp. Tue 6075 TaxID=1661694 RepID=UPI00131CFA3B|nr:hypothetical protein [Streptomyces sp. Tue 6075]